MTKVPLRPKLGLDRPTRNHHDTRNLWPWRDWMTIGIGVLATEENALNVHPNYLVLVSDTMGSFGDAYSHPRLHKQFAFPEHDLYAVAANQVDRAAGLMPMIAAHVGEVPASTRSFGDIFRAIGQALFFFKMEHFNLSVLPKYGLPPATLAPSTIPRSSLIAALSLCSQETAAKLEQEWAEFNLGCDLIIGAFDHSGQAMLFYLYGDQTTVHNASFPGFWAIGSGEDNAKFWLSHRKHTMGMSLKRSAYHAYEAKLMAEGSAHVNEHLDITVATKGKYWNVTTHKPDVQSDCPISFAMLKEAYAEFGPKSTDNMDKPASTAASA